MFVHASLSSLRLRAEWRFQGAVDLAQWYGSTSAFRASGTHRVP